MEPIIHEAYGLLTGNRTRESGLWTVLDDKDHLKGETLHQAFRYVGLIKKIVLLYSTTKETHQSPLRAIMVK